MTKVNVKKRPTMWYSIFMWIFPPSQRLSSFWFFAWLGSEFQRVLVGLTKPNAGMDVIIYVELHLEMKLAIIFKQRFVFWFGFKMPINVEKTS